MWSCPCGESVPAQVAFLHRRVCTAVEVSPDGDTDPAWYEEQLKLRDDALTSMQGQLKSAKDRLETALAARDKAEARVRQHQASANAALQREAAMLRAKDEAILHAGKLRIRTTELEDQLKRLRRDRNGERGSYPLDEANRRELAKLMVTKPGRGYEKD